jgi:hypothetical protein
MVGNVSAHSLFFLEYQLLRSKAAEKVYKAFKDKWCGKRASESIKTTYGPEAADWLAKQGITDGGFNPKRRAAESTDYYMGLELEASIEGLPSVPSFNEFAKKVGKKLTPREALLKEAYDQCTAFEVAHTDEAERQAWIDKKARESTDEARGFMRHLAEIKFAIVVGKAWPSEFPKLGEGTMTMDFEGVARECTLTLREIRVDV